MKVTVLQIDAGRSGADQRWALLEAQARKHAKDGPDLLVWPELFLSGYNVGEALHAHAEPSDGAFAKRVQALAQELGVAILYGYPEHTGGQVYNSALLIDGSGKVLVNHRGGRRW